MQKALIGVGSFFPVVNYRIPDLAADAPLNDYKEILSQITTLVNLLIGFEGLKSQVLSQLPEVLVSERACRILEQGLLFQKLHQVVNLLLCTVHVGSAENLLNFDTLEHVEEYLADFHLDVGLLAGGEDLVHTLLLCLIWFLLLIHGT